MTNQNSRSCVIIDDVPQSAQFDPRLTKTIDARRHSAPASVLIVTSKPHSDDSTRWPA